MTPNMLEGIEPEMSDTVNAVNRDLFGEEAVAVGPEGQESIANQIVAPNPPEDVQETEPLDRLRGLMCALYGSDFPLINALDKERTKDPQWETQGAMPPLETLLPHTSNDEWATWVRGRWDLHAAAVQMHLYYCARNRLFRAGQQWVSSRGIGGPWKTPPRPAEQARVVHNMVRPALNQRIQIVSEQRPGFFVEPSSLSPNEKRKAEGRQQGLEHQWDQQKMKRHVADAAYWAGTDGVAFWHTYWDRDAGPWDERMGNVPGQKKPLGDLRTKTLRVEQVRVSANATSTEPPYYVVIREVLAETEAAYLYGESGVQDKALTGDIDSSNSAGNGPDGMMPSWVLTQTIVGEGYRLENIPTVERYTIYVDKHPDILPYGLQLIVVGNAVIWGPGELLFGVIPVVPVRDGSEDPSYYPRPLMEEWIAPQMRVNAALSLWVNSVRKNSGGQYFIRPDAISRETFTGTGSCLVEVEGSGPIGDQILPMNGFLVGQDVKDLIAFDVKAFEDMSGYNDVSRGQVSNETATAVATANEQLQRTFAPPVEAVAQAAEDWAKVNLAGMAWGYDIPRDVGSVGTDRPDLARALSSDDFDGPASVRVEGEKMMPMPKIYRQAVLDNLLERQIITPQQYMRNAKFAQFRNLNSPDEDQEARAKRVADALRLQVPPEQVPPIRWQDDESIHQDVLQREILLQDDLPPEVIAAADERWKALAQQSQMKQGLTQPPPGAGDDPTMEPGDNQTAEALPTGELGAPTTPPMEQMGTVPPLIQAA